MWEQLKAKLRAALARFAKQKAEDQAEGMADEARGYLDGARDLARRNPLGFGLLIVLGVGLLYLMTRQKSAVASE